MSFCLTKLFGDGRGGGVWCCENTETLVQTRWAVSAGVLAWLCSLPARWSLVPSGVRWCCWCSCGRLSSLAETVATTTTRMTSRAQRQCIPDAGGKMIAPICEPESVLRLTLAACDAVICAPQCKTLLLDIASRCPSAFSSAYLSLWQAFAHVCFS